MPPWRCRGAIAASLFGWRNSPNYCSVSSTSDSKIIGSDVVNSNKDTIGKIDDLIVSSDHKLIAVISVGGFLGIGTKLVAVRYDDLQPTSNNAGFILPGATKDSLKALPEFSYR